MWILLIIVVLVVLMLAFGGFQKGTKSGSLGPLTPACMAMSHSQSAKAGSHDLSYRVRSSYGGR